MMISNTFYHSHTFRRLLMLLCCSGIVAWPLTVSFAQEPVEKPGRSVVRGRVISADSEQPLRRATLRLRKELNRDFLKRTLTNKRGEFTFQGVAAGTYYIEVDAPGIVSLSNGVSFTDFGFSIEDSSLTLVTVDGDNDVKTEVRAVRGAVISGRISYGDGEPATHAQLVLYRQRGPTPVLFFLNRPGVFTDDRGVYRIEGLPAGEYFVGAIENHSGDSKQPGNAAQLVTAFHPAATNASAATLVSVQAGSETRDVNIKFVEEPRRLSGIVKWKQNNAAIKDAVIFLQRVGDPQVELDNRSFFNMVLPLGDVDKVDLLMQDMFFVRLLSTNAPHVASDEKGRWSFQDVPPGTYIISVVAPVPVDPVDKPAKQKSSHDSLDDLALGEFPDFSKGMIRGGAEVKLGDKDVDNVVVELTQGGSIMGTVVIEGESGPKNSVGVKMVNGGPHSFLNLPSSVHDDGSFVLQSVPAGSVRLDIFEPRGDSNYYIRSITGKGLDLRNELLTVADGEQVTGVRIVLGTDLATVEGRVVAASGGGSVAGAGVVLLPADQRKWNIRSSWGLARADAEGKFSLRLAPGEYLAVAWSLANEPTTPLDSYVRSRSSTQRITLTPNETKTIELQAATSREP